MARKKTESADTAVEAMKALSTETESQKRIKELEAQIAAMDKKSEEAALARVCKALGVNPENIKDTEASAPKPKPMVRMFVQTQVNVNGEKYIGDITVSLDTSRVIQQMIGDRRMRMLRELTGNNYILQELQGGGFAPKLIGQVDINGEGMLQQRGVI